MGSYLVRRFGLMLLTLFGISVIIFVMLRIAPGNIADILFDAAGFVNPSEKAQLQKDLGLDKPITRAVDHLIATGSYRDLMAKWGVTGGLLTRAVDYQ